MDKQERNTTEKQYTMTVTESDGVRKRIENGAFFKVLDGGALALKFAKAPKVLDLIPEVDGVYIHAIGVRFYLNIDKDIEKEWTFSAFGSAQFIVTKTTLGYGVDVTFDYERKAGVFNCIKGQFILLD